MARTTTTLDDVQQRPMTGRQILAVALCITINMIDGFDIMSASFTGPGIAREWGLGPTELGLVFASAPGGMVLGAIFLSPLSDIFGRRRMIPAYLVLVTLAMWAASIAPTMPLLLTARVVTGIGVAATMAAINTVVAEQANNRWRDLCLCLQAGGFPLGGTIGALSFYALSDLGWRSVFMLGGCLSAVLVLAVLAWMPESLGFLLARRPRGALERVNRALAQAGLDGLAVLPEPAPKRGQGSAHGAWSGLGAGPLLICLSFFSLMFTFYFLTSWTPKLLTDYGLSAKGGVSGAVLINLGGVIGDLVFAGLALRFSARRLGPPFMAVCFLTAVAFAFVPTTLSSLLPVAFMLGFLLFGSMACLYAMVPPIFPAGIRTTGTGLALGLGRIGATVGPYVGGWLIAASWSRPAYLIAMAAPLLACAAMTFALARRDRAMLD